VPGSNRQEANVTKLTTRKSTSTKLTDTQRIVLSRVVQREDGAATLPEGMTENAAQKLAATLVEREFVREIRAKPGMPAWRRSEEGRSQALVLTKLGRAAIKVVNDRQPEDTELGVETSASSEGLKAHKAAPDGKGPITIGAWLRYAEQRVPQLYDDIQAGRIQAVKVEAANDAARSLTKEPIIDPAFRDQIANHAQTPQLFDFYKQQNDPVVQIP
jgi:hypothetical protein